MKKGKRGKRRDARTIEKILSDNDIEVRTEGNDFRVFSERHGFYGLKVNWDMLKQIAFRFSGG